MLQMLLQRVLCGPVCRQMVAVRGRMESCMLYSRIIHLADCEQTARLPHARSAREIIISCSFVTGEKSITGKSHFIIKLLFYQIKIHLLFNQQASVHYEICKIIRA